MMIWRQWPTEIEADLLSKVDIHDWHRGTRNSWGGLTLSSRRLLALLEFLPDTSAFKAAAERDGDGYTHNQLVAAETYNELARLRASYHAVHGGSDNVYTPHEFIDPVLARMRAERDATDETEREDDNEAFYADMGWS